SIFECLYRGLGKINRTQDLPFHNHSKLDDPDALFQEERQGINLTFIIPLRRLYCTILLPTMPIDQKDSILSQDTFRQIFQNSAEGIIIVNEEGRIFLANPVAEKMFGYDPGELVDMHLGKLLPERFRARHAVH